jgi:hypothetical protein
MRRLFVAGACLVVAACSAAGSGEGGDATDGGSVAHGSDASASRDAATAAVAVARPRGVAGGALTRPATDAGKTDGTPDASAGFAGLHAVMGTSGRAGTIADASGRTVVLHGVDESGSENFCTTWGPPAVVLSPAAGPSPLTQASLTAMKAWGINTVRIPVNEDCWLALNGVASAVAGAQYVSPIQQAVDLITKTNGMYVILDLHWAAPGSALPTAQGVMPDLDHAVAFWSAAAATFKDNGSVIFDLFNEPQMSGSASDAAFACWKDGSTAASSGECPSVDFAVAGMQTLVNAVRKTGAENLLMIGGLGYASQLTLWPKYVPTDTLSPPNIAASWHVYDDQGGCTSDLATSVQDFLCPDGNLGAGEVMKAGYPIVVGETGFYSCSGSTGQAWWPGFLGWADSQGIGFVAWAWSDANDPQLLSDVTSFTPSANGQVYKTYLSCIAGKTVTPAASCTSVPHTGCE